MRSLRDLLIFVLCGTGLIVWGIITALSPGASEITDAGSPYWTIPLGAAMLAAGMVLGSRSRRRGAREQDAQNPANPVAQPEPAAEDGSRGPEGTPPPPGA